MATSRIIYNSRKELEAKEACQKACVSFYENLEHLEKLRDACLETERYDTYKKFFHFKVDEVECDFLDGPTIDVRMSAFLDSNLFSYVCPQSLDDVGRYVEKCMNNTLPGYSVASLKPTLPEIKNVIFNNPATIVFWADGDKTVVKAQRGDKFDPEKGLTMAIVKKLYGNKGSYCEKIKKWLPKKEEKKSR